MSQKFREPGAVHVLPGFFLAFDELLLECIGDVPVPVFSPAESVRTLNLLDSQLTAHRMSAIALGSC